MRATKEETNKTVINIRSQFIKIYYTKKYQFDKMDLVICEQGRLFQFYLLTWTQSVLMFKATPVWDSEILHKIKSTINISNNVKFIELGFIRENKVQ